jgi:hypothetical protein
MQAFQLARFYNSSGIDEMTYISLVDMGSVIKVLAGGPFSKFCMKMAFEGAGLIRAIKYS